MYSKKSNLRSIMSNWGGEDVQLKAQGFKIVTHQNRSFKNKKHDYQVGNEVGSFTRIGQGNLYSNSRKQKENYVNLHFHQNEEQFVVRAKSKSPNRRVSLADLGEIYTNSRAQLNKLSRRHRFSENYPQSSSRYTSNKYNYNTDTKQNKHYYEFGTTKQNPYGNFGSRKCQAFGANYLRKPLSQHNHEPFLQPIPQNYQKYTCVNNNESMEQIMESINGIKLPDNEIYCPEYEKANIKFENMKSEILSKIIQSGEVDEIQSILKQIRQAADFIIMKHKNAMIKAQRNNAFSFRDHLQDNTIPNIKFDLNKIDEAGDDNKTQYISLPQFKDEGGSISSILSINELMKKEEKESKHEGFELNLLINEGDKQIANKQEENSTYSIKPIIIQDLNINKNQESSLINLRQEPKKKENPPYYEQSMRVKDTITMPKASLCYENSIQVKQIKTSPKIEEIKASKTGQENAFTKKKQPYYDSKANYRDYQLQKLTSEPIKIIGDLEKAKKFDPEVVKYTELKVKYLETKTVTSENVRIPSPLRFRRKQEVVKHLVAANIVQKESHSIQY